MGSINKIDVEGVNLSQAIRGVKGDLFNRVRISREIIPIVFVPGIMGSRLKNKKTGQIVWDPDRTIMCMLRKYGGFWSTPAQRKRMLIGEAFDSNYLAVDENNAEHNQRFNSFLDPSRPERGWGGVYWGSYGKFLEELQTHDWSAPLKAKAPVSLKECVGLSFEFPVYAFGYNWTDTNLNSGERLAARIRQIIKWYQSRGRRCENVILVSHSMGGLVCRSACKIHHAEKQVLGIIHGVQPVTGAPAAYWRMKAGFERTGNDIASRIKGKASAWVLGTNGEEVTCILGNSPGGLELLPNQHYTDNNGDKGWLRIPGIGGKEYRLPRNGDPYNEIYKLKTNQYWRLITPEWLDPRDERSRSRCFFAESRTTWDGYIKCIEKAAYFHNKLKIYYHPNTYQFISCSHNTVDTIQLRRKRLIYKQVEVQQGFRPPRVTETIEPLEKVSSRGTRTFYVDQHNQEIQPPLRDHSATYVVTMLHPDDCNGGGDGTVPNSSSGAFKSALDTHQLNAEHQDAYSDEKAARYVVSAVKKLALRQVEVGQLN